MSHVLGPLRLRNPILKAATFEGMSPAGRASPALEALHRGIAAGGAAMTTVAYGAVEPEGRTFADQLLLNDEAIPALRSLTDAVHAEGAAASIQLAHCGGFSRIRTPRGPRGPSGRINLYGLATGVPWVGEMSPTDLRRTADAFSDAARRVVRAGFDAVEVHLGHGYLLHQFLSPLTNRRRDAYGGDAERRLRFPMEVVARVREAVGPNVAVLTKLNLTDGLRGGLHIEDAIRATKAAQAAGADATVLSCGVVDRTPFMLLRGETPVAEMARYEPVPLMRFALRAFSGWVLTTWPYEDLFLLDLAREVRARVDGTLVLLGGVTASEHLTTAAREGFDFVQVGRALLHDPTIARRWMEGPPSQSGCTHCNRCVAEMEHEGTKCVVPA